MVSGGLDDCQVGYLPEGYSVDDKRLHGRLVQVIEIIGDSSAPHKKALSNEHGGLCHGIIIDKVDSDDNSIDQIIDGYNTDGSIDLDD